MEGMSQMGCNGGDPLKWIWIPCCPISSSIKQRNSLRSTCSVPPSLPAAAAAADQREGAVGNLEVQGAFSAPPTARTAQEPLPQPHSLLKGERPSFAFQWWVGHDPHFRKHWTGTIHSIPNSVSQRG